ncbi:ABC transporter permease [Patescibacteria group bacterium]|nr:ABC transporter permease [Patescibacteria group bacterium]
MKQKVWAGAAILWVLAVWETISKGGIINPALFPPPSEVASALWQLLHEGLLNDVVVSVSRMGSGLLLGSVLGILIGILTGRVQFVRLTLLPLLQILRPLPPVAIIPLVIVWFGIGDSAKIFSIAFAVFFPVWINTDIGVNQVPKMYLWSASLFGASWWKTLRSVIFPASLPYIIAGIRNGIAIAFVMIFVSELAGASEGLGYRISISNLSYRIDQMIAALLVLAALGALTDQLFVRIIHRLNPWLRLT